MTERPTKLTDAPEVSLPGTAGRIAHDKPELWEAFQRLGSAASGAGPRDDRTRRLVNLALALGADSEGAVHSHCRLSSSEVLSPE